eukprot:jgi/Phyca11/17142/fgenesh1_pg.PHYCAscaffold_25_\
MGPRSGQMAWTPMPLVLDEDLVSSGTGYRLKKHSDLQELHNLATGPNGKKKWKELTAAILEALPDKGDSTYADTRAPSSSPVRVEPCVEAKWKPNGNVTLLVLTSMSKRGVKSSEKGANKRRYGSNLAASAMNDA